jgi:hypothetical protein
MTKAIQEADREGAPEEEIEELAVRGFEITRRIMAAGVELIAAEKERVRAREEEMERLAERKRHFARSLSDTG